MYARNTDLPYEPGRQADVRAFWASDDVKTIAEQPGFKLSVVMDSREEGESKVRAMTVWDSPEDFERFFHGDHVSLNQPMRDAGMNVTARAALDVISWITPNPGEVRLIHLQLDAAEYDDVLSFWREEGKALVTRQPGNIGAWALCDAETHEFILVFAWHTPEAGEVFLKSEEHVKDFAPKLGKNTSRVSLRRLELV